MEFENRNLENEGNYCDGDEDAFYVELRRQILLLTADDDEDEELYHAKLSNSSIKADSKRGSSRRLTSVSSCAFQQGSYFHLWEGENADAAPTWLVNLWKRSGNNIGTGVFIPQTVKSRRRYRPAGRTSNEKGRIYRVKKQL